MLQANGQRVLEIIGKDTGAQGIILPEEIGGSIAALQAAIASEETAQQEAIAKAKARGEVPPSFDAINLRKRAWPFVEMLQRCQREKAAVTWGV